MTDLYFGSRSSDHHGGIRLTRFHLRLKTYPRIPDRRACIMKYRSGNAARQAPRGAFAFEFPDRISPSFPLRRAEQLLCSPYEVATLPRVNFPATLGTSMAYFFRRTSLRVLQSRDREKEKSSDFANAYVPMKQSVERSRRSLDNAMFMS